MVFIINRTADMMGFEVINEESVTSLALTLSKGETTTLHEVVFTTKDADIAAAINKRFPSGKTHLKHEINSHDFYIPAASTGYVFKELTTLHETEYAEVADRMPETGDIGYKPMQMVAISSLAENRSEFEKYIPRNIIVIVTPIEDHANMELIDSRNAVASAVVDVDNYSIGFFAIKWPNWGTLRFPTVIRITSDTIADPIYYQLGADMENRHYHNTLTLLNEADSKKMTESILARATEALNKKMQSGDDHRKPYNNDRNNNGQRNNYRPRQNNRPAGRPTNNQNPRGNQNNRRGGNNRNNSRGGKRG